MRLRLGVGPRHPRRAFDLVDGVSGGALWLLHDDGCMTRVGSQTESNAATHQCDRTGWLGQDGVTKAGRGGWGRTG